MKEQIRNKISVMLLLLGVVIMFLGLKNGIEQSIIEGVLKHKPFHLYFLRYIPLIIGLLINLAYLIFKKTKKSYKIEGFIFLGISLLIGITLFFVNVFEYVNIWLISIYAIKIFELIGLLLEILLLLSIYLYFLFVCLIEQSKKITIIIISIITFALLIELIVYMTMGGVHSGNYLSLLYLFEMLIFRIENYANIFIFIVVMVKVYKTYIKNETNKVHKALGLLFYLPPIFLYLIRVVNYVLIFFVLIIIRIVSMLR